MNTKKLIIISGPSGAGEDSIIAGLCERMNAHVVITSTTRSPRSGETDGNPYYFLTQEEFEGNIREEKMAEWAQHYNEQYYGVTKEELRRVQEAGEVGLWKIDYKGVISAKEMFPDIKAIFIMADSLEILEKRLRGRKNVTNAYIAERMEYTREWLNHTEIYDYEVINREGHLAQTINDVYQIIQKETATT